MRYYFKTVTLAIGTNAAATGKDLSDIKAIAHASGGQAREDAYIDINEESE